MLVKKKLVIAGTIALAVGVFLVYPEAKMIMCGDRIMQEFPPGYLGMTMSNKNWLLATVLGIVGGSTGYIAYAFAKKKGRFTRK